MLGSYDTPGPGEAQGVQVSGSIAYLAVSGNNDGSGLQIVDVSNPAAPSLLGSSSTPSLDSAYGVFVKDSKAYVAHGVGSLYNNPGLHILDVSNPAAPLVLGRYDTPARAKSVYVSGSTAYVSAYSSDNQYLDSGLYIIDVSNPAAPSLLGFHNTSKNPEGIHVLNGTAYVTVYDQRRLGLVDVSNPTTPSLLSSYDASNWAYDVFVSGSTAYLCAGKLDVLDVAGCEGLEFPIGRPICDIQLNGTTFGDGDTVTADVFRIANEGTAAIPVEFAIWMEAPGLFPIRILKIGSLEEGTIQSMNLPPGHEQDDGPIDLFIIDSTFPRGDYVIGLKMVDPVTQKLLTFDLNYFTILP